MIMKSTTYYVSSLNGNDSNSGTAQTEAFKTLDTINKIKLMPGDRVLLEKGSVFENDICTLKTAAI